MSLKNDAKAEAERLQYLLDNYYFEDDERKQVEAMRDKANKICGLENQIKHYKELSK